MDATAQEERKAGYELLTYETDQSATADDMNAPGGYIPKMIATVITFIEIVNKRFDCRYGKATFKVFHSDC